MFPISNKNYLYEVISMNKFGKFLKSAVTIKMNTCIIFTAFLIIRLVIISLFLKDETVPTSMIWQFLLISFVCAVLQWFAFSEDVIKKMKYVYRNILFLAPFFILLSGAAYLWSWFDTTQIIQWSLFALIFLLTFIGISIGFSIYFKVTGQKYNEKLEQYKIGK